MTEAPIADHGLIGDWQTAALAPLSDEPARPRSAVQGSRPLVCVAVNIRCRSRPCRPL
jgi:hypothetical protein